MSTHKPATQVAGWALVAASADLTSKAGAAWLHSHEVLPGRIVQTVNPAFSLGVARTGLPLMVVLAATLIAGFGGWTGRLAVHGHVPTWAPGLLIGGAGANLADRVIFGAVHDWLLIKTVVFNLADFLVLAGLLGVGIALANGSRRPSGASASPSHQACEQSPGTAASMGASHDS